MQADATPVENKWQSLRDTLNRREDTTTASARSSFSGARIATTRATTAARKTVAVAIERMKTPVPERVEWKFGERSTMQTMTSVSQDECHNVFVEGLNLIDLVNPMTGKGAYSNESLEEVRKRYPNAHISDFDGFIRWKERQLCTEPKRITRKRWWEMLEVLPPQNWQRSKVCDFECFELCEHLSGRVTSIYCRWGKKYFGFNGIAGTSIEANFAHCGGVAKKG